MSRECAMNKQNSDHVIIAQRVKSITLPTFFSESDIIVRLAGLLILLAYAWGEMRILVCHLDALIPQSFCDGYGRKSEFKLTDMQPSNCSTAAYSSGRR